MNNIIKLLKRMIRYPFLFWSSKGLFDKMPEDKYLCRMYKEHMGKTLNLSDPQTFTEKIQWIKLYDRNPQYTIMQDKLLVRDFVAERIGNQYLIPLLGVWDSADDIDFDKLPEQFVLKCNHDCASVTICRNKDTFDFEAARKHLNHCLEFDYSRYSKEWAYQDIPHKIIAEKYMQDGESETLTDYKFYSFNGKVKMVMAISGAPHSRSRSHIIYDTNWKKLPVYKKNDVKPDIEFDKPCCLEQLIELAEKIGAGIPFVRVDFYVINNHPYFGEIAFYPDSGYLEFYPEEWENKIGSWIKLPIEDDRLSKKK